MEPYEYTTSYFRSYFMSILPSEINEKFIVRLKANASYLKESSEVPLSSSQARDLISQELGFKDYQQVSKTKKNYEKQAVKNIVKPINIVIRKTEKGKKCLLFDMTLEASLKLPPVDFLKRTMKMEYLRKFPKRYLGSWYLASTYDLHDLEVIHKIVNDEPVAIDDCEIIFAIEIDNSLFSWFSSHTFKEVITQIQWAMAYLMLTDPSKRQIVLTQADESQIDGHADAIEKIYNTFPMKVRDEWERLQELPFKNQTIYDSTMFNPVDRYMKSLLGYGIAPVMKTAFDCITNRHNEYNFRAQCYGIREVDINNYYKTNENRSPLLRVESDNVLLNEWMKKYKEFHKITDMELNEPQKKKFIIFKRSDRTEEKKWYRECIKEQKPYITICNKVKYCEVQWDYLTFEPEYSLSTNRNEFDDYLENHSEYNIKTFQKLFHKYANDKSEYSVSSGIISFKNILIKDSESCATELHYLVQRIRNNFHFDKTIKTKRKN